MMSPDRSPPSRPDDKPPGGRPHLVVISDDADLRTFLHEGLQLTGFWVSSIASGIQAIEVLRLRRFDLILIDGRLGGLSAGEVIRRIRAGTPDGSADSVAPVAIVDPPEDEGADVDLVLSAPIDLDSLAPPLLAAIADWRGRHPDVPWADAPARIGKRPDASQGR